MDELLQKLMEAEVLSEETKSEIEAAVQSQLSEAIDAAKEEAAADVRAELTEQWVTERDALIEAVDSKVDELLEGEIDELKDDIERFRDLEAEYAEKLVEARASMADELRGDLGELVEKIDAFLEIRLSAELEELKEDIDTVKKNDFGKRVFEAFKNEFESSYADDESAEVSLRETEERLEETSSALEKAEAKIAKMERERKMKEVLSPLAGRQKEVMEAILKNVDTENLVEGYKTFIGRVIKETEEFKSEKEEKVLAESEESDEAIVEEAVVTGDLDESIVEENNTIAQTELDKWKALAGIK